jgi:hypothetical protein
MSSIAAKFFADGDNLLHHATAGNVTTNVSYLPTAGIEAISFVCLVTMGNATDMTITFKTADDTSGTSATALTQNVPIWRNGVRGSDAKAFTESEATGDFVYVVEVPASIIPAGKYIGCYADAGNSSNKYSVVAMEAKYHNG